MSNKKFGEYDGFRGWMNLSPGDTLEFPLGKNSPGWVVRVEEEQITIESDFYKVQPCEPYGAPKIIGHCLPFGGEQCSGVIEFGLDKDGEVAVTNRRRLTAEDELGDEEGLVDVIVGQPDRCEEPVAVTTDLDRKDVAELSAESKLDLYQRVGDALEADAVRSLLKWADDSLDE